LILRGKKAPEGQLPLQLIFLGRYVQRPVGADISFGITWLSNPPSGTHPWMREVIPTS
jgi:hypothetical protein